MQTKNKPNSVQKSNPHGTLTTSELFFEGEKLKQKTKSKRQAKTSYDLVDWALAIDACYR